MAGMSPINADEVNNLVGTHLRAFVDVQESIEHDANWMAGVDLTAAPYNMSPEDQTLIKSAINGLNSALAAVDMTFINQLTGLF